MKLISCFKFLLLAMAISFSLLFVRVRLAKVHLGEYFVSAPFLAKIAKEVGKKQNLFEIFCRTNASRLQR